MAYMELVLQVWQEYMERVTTDGGSGVSGDNVGRGYGVSGSSSEGYGGLFVGGLAPIYLEPSSISGTPPPTTGNHRMGELYVDSGGELYFCIQNGTPGTWKKVQLV